MGSSQSQYSHNTSDSSSNESDSEDSEEFRSVGSGDMEIENSQLTSDAAFTEPKRSFNYLSMDEIKLLDNNLDQNDKISFVYLMYDDPNKACDILSQPLDVVVQKWFIREAQTIQKWNWKVLEALCIIKHFKVLKTLGYNKSEMVVTFLPYNNSVHLQINVVRKALYCLFEDLLPYQINHLFLTLKKDLQQKHINVTLNEDNLEETFLHLETSGYFSLNDLTNLTQLFKRTDMLTQYEHFKALQETLDWSRGVNGASFSSSPSNNSSFMNDDVNRGLDRQDNRPDDHPEDYRNVSEVQQKLSVNLRMKNKSLDADENYYVDPSKPGLLLIIDNEEFYTECRNEYKHLRPKQTQKLDNRLGTQVDRESLEKVFKGLNFTVVVKSNVRHEILKGVIKECVNEVEEKDYSSFFVAILSHGDKGVIYGCNTIPVEISEIQETLYAPSLSGKPKILLIQACQGEKRQTIDEEYTTDGFEAPTSNLASPRTSDALVFYATIPNYTAIRHLKKGTWFIQSLCEKLASSKNDHFEEICLKVKREVASKRWGKVIMVALTESTLTKKLYLTPH